MAGSGCSLSGLIAFAGSEGVVVELLFSILNNSRSNRGNMKQHTRMGNRSATVSCHCTNDLSHELKSLLYMISFQRTVTYSCTRLFIHFHLLTVALGLCVYASCPY